MNREPDWETIAEINFLLHRRMSEHLNAALSAVSLIDTTESKTGQPPQFWQQRALNETLNVLDLHNAWASLVRYKMGETFMPQHKRQFQANDLLRWLARELQLIYTPQAASDVTLSGNRETLQEALVLLRSSAHMLGPGVQLFAQPTSEGMWFHVRFHWHKPPPTTLDSLLESFGQDWRARSTVFELKRARDFLAMNNCELTYQVVDEFCELSFFVYAVGKKPSPSTTPRTQLPQSSDVIAFSSNDSASTLIFADREQTTLVKTPPEDL